MNEDINITSNFSTISCATNPSACYFCQDDHVPWNIPVCGQVGSSPVGLANGVTLFTSQMSCESANQIGQFGNSPKCKSSRTAPTRGISMSENKGRKIKKSELKSIINKTIREIKLKEGKAFVVPKNAPTPTNPYGDNLSCLIACLATTYVWGICAVACGLIIKSLEMPPEPEG